MLTKKEKKSTRGKTVVIFLWEFYSRDISRVLKVGKYRL